MTIRQPQNVDYKEMTSFINLATKQQSISWKEKKREIQIALSLHKTKCGHLYETGTKK